MEPKNDTIRIPPCLKRNGSLPIVGNQSKSRPSPSRCWMLMFGRRTQQVCVHSTARRAGWLTVYLCLPTWHYNRHVTIFATGTMGFWFLFQDFYLVRPLPIMKVVSTAVVRKRKVLISYLNNILHYPYFFGLPGICTWFTRWFGPIRTA